MQSDARKEKIKIKPLKDLRVDGSFTEDRDKLQRHCEEVDEDVEETLEIQGDRIKKKKTDGDIYFTEEGRVAEITVDFREEPRWRKKESTDQRSPS